MSSTALIVRPQPVRSRADAIIERRAAQDLGGHVLSELANGTLIEAEASVVAALMDRGFRVRVHEDTHIARFGSAEIDTERGTPELPRSLRVPSALRDTWPHHLVQLVAPPNHEWNELLAELGIRVVGPVDRYTLLVVGDAEMVERAVELPFVTWTGAVEPAYRIHPVLDEKHGTIHNVLAAVFPPERLDETASALEELKAEIVRTTAPPTRRPTRPSTIIFAIQRRRLAAVARLPYVQMLEYSATEPEWHGERETQIVAERLNAAGNPIVGYQNYLANIGLDGNGVTVSICDSGIDMNANNNADGHLDLRGRQAAFVDHGTGTASDVRAHGTHVAGIAVGNATTGQQEGAAPGNFLWGQGMAPGAQYVNQCLWNVLAWPVPADDATSEAVTNAANVQNQSWGDASGTALNPSGYNAYSRDLDELVRDADPSTAAREALCIVRSAGNNGGSDGSMSSPSEAKNVISVGATHTVRPADGAPHDQPDAMAGFSSRGPAQDGRIAPTVVAPGVDVASMQSENALVDYFDPIPGTGNVDPANAANMLNQYRFMSGTSMAAPHVAGLCALLTEWWRDRTEGRDPSPAMLKALIVNGAEDIADGANWRVVHEDRWISQGGDEYRCNNLGFAPVQVLDRGLNNLLAQQATLANCQATANSWFYDGFNDRLTINLPLGGGWPPTAWGRVEAEDGNAIDHIPSDHQGWGRVSLPNIVEQAPDPLPAPPPAADRGPKLFVDQRHAFTADTQSIEYRVSPVANRPLRITLVWTDAPGVVGAARALRNNLDLEVVEVTTGNVFQGNQFNPATGFAQTGGAADIDNNVECVYIEQPAGTYRVRILPTALDDDALDPGSGNDWQDFALVIDNGEFASTAPVSVAVVLDRSGSMVSSGYVDVTRDSTKQFIDLMRTDDGLGVVSFGDSGTVEYSDGASVKAIADAGDLGTARTSVDNIAFGGWTYMGEGMELAEGLLASATTDRAMVLFSDGKDNKGGDEANPAKKWAVDVAAALPADLPVYTCAMGALSDQDTLDDIADLTGGRYYYMPTGDDLKEIYNYIGGQITDTGIVVNESGTASYASVPAYVERAAEEVTFAVAWANTSKHWVDHVPQSTQEIRVRLRDPDRRILPVNDSWIHRRVGKQHVLFRLTDPRPGLWHVLVDTTADEHTQFTVGGFVRSPIRLEVLPNVAALRRGILEVEMVALHGEKVIREMRATAVVTSPILSISGLLERHNDALRRVRPPKHLLDDGMDRDLARLVTYRDRLLREGGADILGTLTEPVRVHTGRLMSSGTTLVTLEQSTFRRGRLLEPPPTGRMKWEPLTAPSIRLRSGLRVGELLPIDPLAARSIKAKLNTAGSHNLVVEATGHSPVDGGYFARKELISVVTRN